MVEQHWPTVAEAAKRAGVTVGMIARLLRDGRLDGKKINGKCWIVNPRHLMTYVDQEPGVGRPRKNSAKKWKRRLDNNADIDKIQGYEGAKKEKEEE